MVTCMFEKTKNLFPNGSIKNTIFKKEAIIMDIPKKINLIKAYRLQFDTLGFIANGSQIIKDTSPIKNMVNGQINKQDTNFFEDAKYRNARSLILQYFKKPEKLNKNSSLYSKFIAAMDSVYCTNKEKGNCPHTALINRLFRNNKGEALYKHLERLEGL